MPWHSLVPPLKWLLTLTTLAVLLGLAHVIHEEAKEEREREGKKDEKVERKNESDVKKIRLKPQEVKELGLKLAKAQAKPWRERFVVYGRIIANPRATVELRAAYAGTLRKAEGTNWPALGKEVPAGQELGRLDVRIGPQERLDLQTKFREASLKEKGAETVHNIQKERLERLKMAGGGVSASELDAARVQLAEAQTQLQVAQAAVKQWRDALEAIDGQSKSGNTVWSQPLASPQGGEAVEAPLRPGMTVQAGDLLLRVVDYRRVLVRLDFPPAALADGPPASLELSTARTPDGEQAAGVRRFVVAQIVGPAPQVDPVGQLAGYWYEAVLAADKTHPQAVGHLWRPGLFVKGQFPAPKATEQPAVVVPLSALLYYKGEKIVYVQTAPDEFLKRTVQVLGQAGDKLFLAGGVRPDEEVVYERAQVLLSEGLRGEGMEDDD
jgi:hypothetical protein